MTDEWRNQGFDELCERLAPDGVLAQWLPIYNVTPEETRGIVRTFLAEFPESALWYNGANLLLLGFKGTFELSLRGVRERLQHPGIATDLAVSHLGGPNELLADPKYFVAGFLMGPVGLAALAKGGPIYTDNRPALEFTWRGFPEWGPERVYRLILANMAAIRPHVEAFSPYLRDGPAEVAPEIAGIRERYLRRLQAVAIDGLGSVAWSRGRVADALELYRQALALSPDFAQAHVNLASLLQRMGRLDAAGAEYSEAIRLEPRHAEAYYGLGTLGERRERPAEALRAYHRAVEIKGDFRLALARIAALRPRGQSLDSAER